LNEAARQSWHNPEELIAAAHAACFTLDAKLI
jgi:organic hydroperoxide reductase OsmC/OhrA